MKGRRAKKGAVLATAVAFMTIIIALSVLVVVFASSGTKRAVSAAKRANGSIMLNLIGDKFVATVKKCHESYYIGAAASEGESTEVGEGEVKKLPVAAIDEQMNKFVAEINENYSCEVSVLGDTTYLLKLIETVDEKETQIFFISVTANEFKGEQGGAAGYTYNVVKWDVSNRTVEEPGISELGSEDLIKLAQKFLQLYISENHDGDALMVAMSRYIQNMNEEKFSEHQYSITPDRENNVYSVIYEGDNKAEIVFKYSIVYDKDDIELSFVIYDSETYGEEKLNKKYGFVVYTSEENGETYCVIYPYDENGNAIGGSETDSETTAVITTATTATVSQEGNE